MPDTQFMMYRTAEGDPEVQVRFEDETVWLSQAQIAELFLTTKQNVSLHVRNIFGEGELQEESVVKDYLTTAADGKQYRVAHYNLDVIISVGYRVKSVRGTQFRIWATQRLREFLVKGFLLNDRRFKEKDGDRYFDELLQRIRDIRSSEKVFWRKVLEIYATSEDYNPTVAASKRFFTVVQNKMHWAAHGHTAAEIIHERADASKRNMGLTNYPGDQALKSDAGVAKNYLNPDELDVLNRIVSFYLDFAELQAMNKRTMTMAGWIAKLDEFLQMTERDILNHAGSISHDEAIAKADAEYEKWRAVEANRESAVEADFARAIKESRRLDKQRRKKP